MIEARALPEYCAPTLRQDVTREFRDMILEAIGQPMVFGSPAPDPIFMPNGSDNVMRISLDYRVAVFSLEEARMVWAVKPHYVRVWGIKGETAKELKDPNDAVQFFET